MNTERLVCQGRTWLASAGFFAGLVFFCTCFADVNAQQIEALGGREQRSPWRASFNEINPDAANQTSAEQGWQPVQARSQDSGSPRTDTAPALPANQIPNLNVRTADASTAAATSLAPSVSASTDRSAARQKSKPVAGAAISRTMDSLPNEAGQVWREYDISSYTSKVTSVNNPQQALLDWVLRETGNEMWFNEPLGILHATKSRLIVYHTPEIQSAVKDIVDRFVRTRGQLQSFNINLVTVGNPSWRSQAYPLLQTVDVQSVSYTHLTLPTIYSV